MAHLERCFLRDSIWSLGLRACTSSFKIGIGEIKYRGVTHCRVVTFPAVPQRQELPASSFSLKKEMVSRRLFHQLLRVNIRRMLTPGLLAVILLYGGKKKRLFK